MPRRFHKLVSELTPEELEIRRAKARQRRNRRSEEINAKDRIRKAKWRAANPEKAIAARERQKAATRRWKLNNPEKVKAEKAYWAARDRLRNPGKHREHVRRWKKENPELLDAQKVRAYLRNQDGVTAPPKEFVKLIVTIRRLKRLIKEKQDA